ncbi:hypothetical protein THRCLA_08191 [Thraustotheca clavata]|uniref:EF-hand domain-containing protein n=1 Tax=Thraustotheca clavata TaxID=74557 RepID=A0A1V9Z8N8_9STRA|nr:hypothetical protein THRCLA_08191 [Thraustotheca clavata]
MRVVEKIIWPEPLPVDLFAEFGWILGQVPVRSTPPRIKDFNTKLTQLNATSPYKTQTQSTKAKVILSPQQIAARKVKKLASEYLNYDMDHGCDLGQKSKKRTRPTVNTSLKEAFNLQTWLQEANENISPITNQLQQKITLNDNNGKHINTPEIINSKTTLQESSPNTIKKTKTSPKAHKASPPRISSMLLNKDIDDNDDDVVYEKPFAQLEPKNLWEMQHHEKVKKQEEIKKTKKFQLARWLTKRIKERSYSKEIQTRLAAALTANTGESLWRDQVASQIACELNADNVFGSGSEGNALPFATDAELYDGIEREWVLEEARDIKEKAKEEYAQGHYSEAYSILHDGAKLLTSSERATKSSCGFNYSMDTHYKATKIQILYHKRYCRRTACALQLQTKWRGYHAHHNYLKLQWQRYESVKYIQKWWHDHTADKEKMRLRLQTGMRRKLARIHVKRMRQSIEVLSFWIRIWVLKAIVRIRAKKALRAGILIQRMLRGFLARKFVLQLRVQIQKEEYKRYQQEQDHISRQLNIKLVDFEQYLSKAGQNHVSALAKKLKADKARKKEDRVHFTPEELHRARLLDLFQSYDVDNSGSIDINELKELFEELCIPINRTELENALAEMDVSQNGAIEFDEFFNYINSPTKKKSGPNALWLLQVKLTVKHFVNLFTSSTYKNHAQQFRLQQAPHFECQYCGLPFCFYRPWYYHLKKRDCRESGLAESSESPPTEDELLMLDEEALVRVRLLQVERDVLTYLETKPGIQLLKLEAKQIDQSLKTFQQSHKSISTKGLAADVNIIKYFYQAFDVKENNAMDRQEFCFVMQEIGITLSKKSLSNYFQTIDTAQADVVSFEEFYAWIQKTNELFAWKSRLKQILTRLVLFAMKYHRRKYQSQRCIIEREKSLAEAQVRHTFRLDHPPLVLCALCNRVKWDSVTWKIVGIMNWMKLGNLGVMKGSTCCRQQLAYYKTQ